MTSDPRGRVAGRKGFSRSFLHGVVDLIGGRRLILFGVLLWRRPFFVERFFHGPLFYRCGKEKGALRFAEALVLK